MLTRTWLESQPWFKAQEYPFSSKFHDTIEGKLHYVDEGQGPVLLFVHGTPSWSYEWRHQFAALKTNYRCIAPDFLGFGLSARPENGDYTVAAHQRRLRTFVEKLGLKNFTLIAHDYGGPISLPLAFDGLATKVVLLNSWAWPMESADPSFTKSRKMLASSFMRFLYLRMNFSAQMMVKMAWGKSAKLTSEKHDSYRKMFPDKTSRLGTYGLLNGLLHETALFQNLESRLSSLSSIPVSLIWGMQDKFISPAHLHHWKAVLPQSSVYEIPEAGHFPQDENPDAVLTALTSAIR